jgi:phosphatidate cytidylyltransferase
MLVGGGTHEFTARIGRLFWGIMATVYSLSHAAYLWHLGPEIGAPAEGAGLVLFLLMLGQFNDVAQYCCGKALGGPKVVPRVSPGKTWSGMIGGAAMTTALAVLLGPLLTPFGVAGAAGAGTLIALSGFAGDIVVSAVKREAGVKDAGHIFPGHGGILDRADSLLLSAPLFFHFVRYLYLPGAMS